MAEIQTAQHKSLKWLDIVNLDEKTIEKLSKEFRFHHLDLEDCLSHSQRPKIDEYGEYLFIILHFPVYSPGKKNIELEEVNLFIGQQFVITIHHNQLKILSSLMNRVKKSARLKNEYMSKGSGFLLYEIVKILFDSCFPLIDDLAKDIDNIEKSVFTEDLTPRDMLKDILMIKKDIINFKRIIAPQRPVIAQLEHKNTKFLPPDLEIYFDDVVDKIEKIWNSLQNMVELIESLQNINESIISHNTNMVIKTLTIFSVIMLPLTLVSGIYGMNIVGLPLAETEIAFIAVTILMLGIVGIMLLFFKHKKWL